MAERRFATYWMTRDKRGGALSNEVLVWLVKPERCELPSGDVVWYGWKPDHTTALYSRWTIPQCLYECRVYPETDLELIRNGEEPKLLSPKVS